MTACLTRRPPLAVLVGEMAGCDGFANVRGGVGRLCNRPLAACDGFANARRANRLQTRHRPPWKGGFFANGCFPICKPVVPCHFESLFGNALPLFQLAARRSPFALRFRGGNAHCHRHGTSLRLARCCRCKSCMRFRRCGRASYLNTDDKYLRVPDTDTTADNQ